MAESFAEQRPNRSSRGRRLCRGVRAFFSKGREERFTREEQLVMVIVAHVFFLVGATGIMRWAFGAELSGWPPGKFVIGEMVIIAGCFFAAFVNAKPLISWFRKTFGNPENEEQTAPPRFEVRRRFQAGTLLFAYVLQFAALVPLLEATGGPVDSPFAPMALAIAIFTPFIANQTWTVCFVVLTAVIFYLAFVETYGIETSEGPGPDPRAFVGVNVLILVLATTLTLGYQNRLDRRAARAHAPGISITRTFNAPRSVVWKAWTEPKLLEKWLQMDGYRLSAIKLDLRPGGFWGATLSANGDVMSWEGTYSEVVEPERLVFTISGPGGRGTRTLSIILVETDGRTKLTFRETHPRYAKVEEAWSAAFDRMVAHLSVS